MVEVVMGRRSEQPKDAMSSEEWVEELSKTLTGLTETFHTLFRMDLMERYASSVNVSRRVEALGISLSQAARNADSLARTLARTSGVKSEESKTDR
jgi:hypothetical protein